MGSKRDQITQTLKIGGEMLRSSRSLDEDDRAILGEVRMIGGSMVTILIIALVLTEVYNAVDFSQTNGTYDSPFGSVVSDLETTGVAAMSLLVVGLLVVAASAIMRYFGGGFGGNR
ncbi:hypothetical protein [Natrinema ejinorense]|uniref:Uncharacterized protein n=1 Tax=Natrinema ejinorense TaxID=373386 RepID=A0A2A5QRI0_9EURY|nr:hypothetical protein [Natrinema ejinorense]PCR89446.1 hypothetical protein CP557_02170 [Natrinema ejinorense]